MIALDGRVTKAALRHTPNALEWIRCVFDRVYCALAAWRSIQEFAASTASSMVTCAAL